MKVGIQEQDQPNQPESTKKAPLVSIELAQCPAEAVLDQPALAAMLAVSPRTLRRMITRFEIPPGVKLGGRRVWLAGKVRDYLGARADVAIKESERAAVRMRGLGQRI